MIMKKEKLVKKNDMVTVYGTGSSKSMAQGKVYQVHSIVAEKLVQRGFASMSPIESESSVERKSKKKSD